MSQDFPSFIALQRIARDEVLSRSAALTRAVVERQGTDANAITASGAIVGDTCIGQLIQAQAAVYLDSATGDDLDRLVWDRYQFLRHPATPALGEVQFRSTAAAVLSFTIPVGTRVQTADGREFLTTSAVLYPAASMGPITAPVQSTLAGLDQAAASGTITSIPSPIAGAPAGMNANNALATSGAGNAEDDPELRARAKQYYATAQRGTLLAIERGALATPGVRKAKAFEATNEFGDPARWVQVLVTDQFSEQFVRATGTTPAYETQSQALAAAVNATLQEFRAGGIFVLVQVGVVALVGITLALRIRAGFDHDSVGASAKAFAQDYVNALRPGEDLIIADLEVAVSRAVGVEPLGGSVISPTTDLIANPTVAFRTSISLIVVGECFEVSP